MTSNNPFDAPRADLQIDPNGSAFAELSQRELGPLDLIGLALRVFSARPWLILCIVAAIGVPMNYLSELLAPTDGSEDFGDLAKSIRVVTFLDNMIGILAAIGLAKITEVVARGEQTSGGEIVSHMWRRWLPGIGTGILYRFGCGLLLLLLVVPGVVYLVFWMFCDQVVALRDESGSSALAYSKELVAGRWWKVVGIALVLSLIVGTPFMFLAFVGGMALELVNGSMVLSVAIDTLCDLVLSVMTIAMTLFFLNLDALRSNSLGEV